MASRRVSLAFIALVSCLTAAGCGAHVPQFPLREPMTRDPDLTPAPYPCRPDPKHKDRSVCAPEEYESFLYWDLVDKSVFRPMSRFFAVSPPGESVDVNSLDEVPDSSWFENRAGVRELTQEERDGAFCVGQTLLPESAEPGTWTVDQGKSDGVTPGFRLDVPGAGKFVLKADRLVVPFRASAAEAVGARLYWAAGFNAPCSFVTHLDPKVLKVKPGILMRDQSARMVPFDERNLATVFEQAFKGADGRFRMSGSKWLPGRPMGPFTYEGVHDDDPLDVVPHQDRRELRGAKLMAAWINHYDAREQNSMSTWMSSDPANPAGSPGYVKHWYLDFGDSLGIRTRIDELSRRYGRTYLFDPGEILFDFFTFGTVVRPWERANNANETFPYFTVGSFDPENWVPGYPNPAFLRMTEHDGAWMARVISRIDDETVAAAVGAAKLPAFDAEYLRRTLRGRRDVIVRRYLSRLSPIGNLVASGDEVCGVDLALRSGLFPAGSFRHEAFSGEGDREPSMSLVVRVDMTSGRVCAVLPRGPEGQRSRVRVRNGQAPGALDLHLVSQGGRGSRLLGVRRLSP